MALRAGGRGLLGQLTGKWGSHEMDKMLCQAAQLREQLDIAVAKGNTAEAEVQAFSLRVLVSCGLCDCC